MIVLNLGCGTQTSNNPDVINVDWSIYLRLKRLKILAPIMPLIISSGRLRRFRSLPDNILVHNLKKGIPFGAESVDVAYHSHFLEHLDRNVAEDFLTEVRRVLKPGGIHRIVVPDLETVHAAYAAHISSCESNLEEMYLHDRYVADLFEQSVRRESCGTGAQRPLRRLIENLVLGDARERGETHQWMYDRFNLAAKLKRAGYRDIHVQSYDTSLVPNWLEYGLDTDYDGKQYKPGSLYIEAVK